MRVVHKYGKKEIDDLLKDVGSTAKKYPACLKFRTNLNSHMKSCKKVKRKQLKQEKTKKQDLSCNLLTQLRKWSEEDIRGKSNQKTRVIYLKYVDHTGLF